MFCGGHCQRDSVIDRKKEQRGPKGQGKLGTSSIIERHTASRRVARYEQGIPELINMDGVLSFVWREFGASKIVYNSSMYN